MQFRRSSTSSGGDRTKGSRDQCEPFARPHRTSLTDKQRGEFFYPKGNTLKQKSPLLALAGTLVLGLVATSTAFAAGGHGDDHKPKFGGIVSEGKAFDAELVAKPDLVTVYLSDHGKPMSAKGAKGKITLLSGTDKVEADLAPADDTKLEAKGKFNVASGTKAVVVITPEGKTASTLRFTIK
jgi:hypothetical protein